MGIFGFGKKKIMSTGRIEPPVKWPEPPKDSPITKDEQKKLNELNKGLAEIAKKKQEGKPVPVIEKIPDDIIKLIRDLGEKKNGLLNQFLNISAQVVDIEPKLTKLKKFQKETMEHVKEVDKSISQKRNYAFNELKLNKRTDYNWRFDGQGNFVGTLKPKLKEQPKK